MKDFVVIKSAYDESLRAILPPILDVVEHSRCQLDFIKNSYEHARENFPLERSLN
jgi:hypothetical protein